MEKLVAPLMGVAAFTGLAPQQLTAIARHAQKLKFLGGDVITAAGAPGDGALVIVSGPAERQGDPSPAPAALLAPGSLIGEMAMFIAHDYGATVIARARVLCLKITRAAMLAQMREDPALREHFQRLITERLLKVAEELRAIDDRLAALAGATPPAARASRSGFDNLELLLAKIAI
jgi:CRP-like cAMP-binding protein